METSIDETKISLYWETPKGSTRRVFLCKEGYRGKKKENKKRKMSYL